MNEIIAQNEQLDAHGKVRKPFIKDLVIKKDTIFFECAATLGEKALFDSSSKDPAYKDGQFPNSAYANDILRISVDPNIVFNGTALTNPNNFRRFLNDSYVTFTDSKRLKAKLFIWQVYKDKMTTNPAAIATTVASQRTDKITDWYKLPTPIKVARNGAMFIKFVPAPALTTAAYDVSATPTFPASGLGNSSSGYALSVYLECNEYEAAA